MAFQSIWYQSELNPKIIEIIEEDLTDNFQNQMGDSRLMGDALNRDKRNSKNAWVPTTHWTGGGGGNSITLGANTSGSSGGAGGFGSGGGGGGTGQLVGGSGAGGKGGDGLIIINSW